MDVSAFETGGVLCGCIADDMDRTKGRDTGRSDSCDQHRSSCRISADRAAPVSLLCGRTEVYQSCGVYQNISAFLRSIIILTFFEYPVNAMRIFPDCAAVSAASFYRAESDHIL